ncbi:transposable element Tcb1 transposase [Trichonephila clavipes]|nr:transposable element Tcb1 transposase [Trichonephila clavipes]
MEDSEHWCVVGRIEAGQSITDVALFFGIHHSVISRLWKQFQTTQTVVRRPVGGHPRVTNPAEDRYIAIVAKRNRRATSTRVTSMVTASIGKTISAATVRRRLHMNGMYARVPRVVFLYPSNQEGHDYSGAGNMAIGLCLTGAMSCLLMSQDLLWSQMTSAVQYRDEVLEPIVRLYAAAVDPIFVLMDDNARPHRADIVDDCLESERITCMAWPAYSPDLNPNENFWDALGRAVSSRFPLPATLIELETALQEEWRLLNSAVLEHLIESMVERNITPRVIERDTSGEIYFLKDSRGFRTHQHGRQTGRLLSRQNDANLALPPRFRQILIESPL